MLELIKKIYIRYKEIFWYGVFGVLTTIVNVEIFDIATEIFAMNYMIANIIAWIGAVTIAFITNKLWVFESKSWKSEIWISECFEFVGARLATGVLDMVLMYVMISLGRIDELFSKIVVNIIVIICNYILSKLWVFKKK